VCLTVTAICDGPEPLADSDSVDLTVGWTIIFADLPDNHWAFDSIQACIAAGILTGYPDGYYQPTIPVSRDQMAVFISRALAGGEDELAAYQPPTEPSFSDVSATYWAHKHIEYAFAQNVVGGYADGQYHPTWTVTRGQMTVFIARAIATPTGEAGLADYEPPETATFEDVPTTYWCYKHVEYCAEHEIVSGYSDGSYQPIWPVTRDQMAVFIQRAFRLPE